jgi:uncharacterized membrane protein
LHPAITHIRHHLRFYSAAVIGAAIYGFARIWGSQTPFTLAGDGFFLSFLIFTWWMVIRQNSDDLNKRADNEDEGIFVVLLIALIAIILTSAEIFSVLNQKNRTDLALLLPVLASAPLGWSMLHTMSAFHYANIYYSGPDKGGPGDPCPLLFPGTERPGPWDFVYFSFVVGMTAQVSDVLVQTTQMRRAVMFHSIISFFFNTVLIAMAVNAVVAMFQAA